MAAGEELNVVIFDNSDTDRYREVATEAVLKIGWIPRVFDEVRAAQRVLAEKDDIFALIAGLGEKEVRDFADSFPARPLVSEASFASIPIALLSGSPRASRYINPDAGDVLIPKSPFERIAPALQEWFKELLVPGPV